MGTRIYIGRLPNHTRERDVERFFKGYGRIRDIMLKSGYGFVEFDDYRDADDAVYELNGRQLCGERVVIEHGRGPGRGRPPRREMERERRRPYWMDKYGPPVRTDFRVIVENLSSRIGWQDLKDFMRQAGEVTYADAHRGRKNEGIVEFATHSDMKSAIDKLDNTEINGRKIHLLEDKPAGRSRRSRSRSHSRSRYRSRSPRSRSRSPQSCSKSRSRSRSPSPRRRRTRSRSPSRSLSHERD